MAASRDSAAFVVTLTLIFIASTVNAQVLTPPYFNLAVGKKIEATHTCGEGIDDERELFCKLTGAVLGADLANYGEVIDGQLCDFCSRQPDQSHPAVYALDGTERWWQSPPLSRGLEFNKINLTVDLGQVGILILILILKFGINWDLNLSVCQT